MQYLATHYWQSAESGKNSMLLQQAYHKRKKMSVVLACICTDKKVVSVLSEWFYESVLPGCSKRGEKGIRRLYQRLKCILEKKGNEKGVQMAGALCVGRWILFFQRGRMQIQVLNMRYQRAHSYHLLPEADRGENIMFQEGMIQPDVGLLLATEDFGTCVSKEIWEACLNINEMRNPGSVKRRLCELGALDEEKREKAQGAILLLSR